MSESEHKDFLEKRGLEFYKLHASQRMALFRNFITLVVAIIGLFFYVLTQINSWSSSYFLYLIFFLTPLGLLFVSMAFKRLDKRNRELIDNSIKALKKVEKEYVLSGECLIDNLLEKRLGYTHRKIFKTIFFSVNIIGIGLLVLSFFKVGYDVGRNNYTSLRMAAPFSEDRIFMEEPNKGSLSPFDPNLPKPE